MMNIVCSEEGTILVNSLSLDILSDIDEMIKYVPQKDMIGLEYVYITDIPSSGYKISKDAIGTYHQGDGHKLAYVEIYLARIISFANNEKLINFLYPFIKYQIAQAVFHEIGHHLEIIRSHGIKKSDSENHAISYSNSLLNKYIIHISESLQTCFLKLNELANKNEELSIILNQLKKEFKKDGPISKMNIIK